MRRALQNTFLKRLTLMNKNILALAKISNFVCHHDDFANALSCITECMQITSTQNSPHGSLLIGKGGVGKSTVGRLLEAKNPTYVEIEDHIKKQIIPVFYMPVPSPTTVKSLTLRMLEELGCLDQKGTSEQLNYRLRILLKQSKTKLILLDEFHHIYNSRSLKSRVSENVANWIKTLADETKISICLMGLPSIQDNLFIDEQLSRRFSRVIELHPFSFNLKNNEDAFPSFLMQVSKYIELNFQIRFTPDLSSRDLVARIFLATSGYQAYVMQLIHQSCLIALNDERKVVSIQDFHTAYSSRSIQFRPLTKKNIFSISPAEITAFFN